jgi:selenide,water dikinase
MKTLPLRSRVVLVGGGHAHVQVLRAWAMRPPQGVHVTLVVDDPVATYSGMAPAVLAGELPRSALEIDLLPLARRAGAAVCFAAARGLDLARGRVEVEGRAAVPFDVLSLNVGSSTRGAGRADVRAFALSSRPLDGLLRGWEAAIPRLRALGRPARVVVVGAGAAGVEVAACAAARLRREQIPGEVALVVGDGPWGAGRVGRLVRAALEARGVELVSGVVDAVHADAVTLGGEQARPSDLTFWVTGAAPRAEMSWGALPTDGRGFLQVDATLRVVGQGHIFAAGDAAWTVGQPWVPRAGVYAVRQGPVLAHNLAAVVAGRPLRRWRAQSDFLAMLNLGDGEAIVSKWGLVAQGAWVRRWKEKIDREFVSRFQVLDPSGAPRPEAPGAMVEDMACGGCAAKVDAEGLDRALCALPPPPPDAGVVWGPGEREDVAIWRVGGEIVAATVDGFPAFTDDPWLVGRGAVVHACSDLYAKGARPTHALVHVVVPGDLPGGDTLEQVMAGVSGALADEGAALVGGHTSVGAALTVTVTAFGRADGAWWSQRGARPGDALVLSRPLGAGVLWRGDRLGLARGDEVRQAIARTLRSHRPAAEVAGAFSVRAATDVTGFGLAGHLAGMMAASGAAAEIWTGRLPRLSGVDRLFGLGVQSTAAPANRRRADVDRRAAEDPLVDDPHTGASLLLAVPASEASALIEAWAAIGEAGAVIGRVVGAEGGARVRLRRGP